MDEWTCPLTLFPCDFPLEQKPTSVTHGPLFAQDIYLRRPESKCFGSRVMVGGCCHHELSRMWEAICAGAAHAYLHDGSGHPPHLFLSVVSKVLRDLLRPDSDEESSMQKMICPKTATFAPGMLSN